MKTNAEYLETSACCPNCGSRDIAAGMPWAEETEARERVECFNCKMVWEDRFALVGFEVLQPPAATPITYGHLFTLAFTVENESEDGAATDAEILEALRRRIRDITDNGEVQAAVQPPEDTCLL